MAIAALALTAGASPSGGDVRPVAEADERVIRFGGFRWDVKRSSEPVGPGPNRFSGRPQDVWVDDHGRLHLTITKRDGHWWSTEIVSRRAFGHGRYVFSVAGPVEDLDPNAVLGLFTWSDEPEEHHREIDVELSRWGDAGARNAQFVVQPWHRAGHRHRFRATAERSVTTYSFAWRSERVNFLAQQGPLAVPPEPGDLIERWSFAGDDVPSAEGAHARINLWLFRGDPPAEGERVELVLTDFDFQ